jgi:hypothetical protein
MKSKVAYIACIAVFLLLFGCDDTIKSPFEILSVEYTGVDTARVVYKAVFNENAVPLKDGDVFIFKGDYKKRYTLKNETAYREWGRNTFAIDITVEPNWEPGDKVTVTGRGFYLGDVSFDVPQ